METIGDYILAFIIITFLLILSYVACIENFYTNKPSMKFEEGNRENHLIIDKKDIGDHFRFLKFRNTSPPKNINPKVLNFKKAENLMKTEDNNFNEKRFRESLYQENKKNKNTNQDIEIIKEGKKIFYFLLKFQQINILKIYMEIVVKKSTLIQMIIPIYFMRDIKKILTIKIKELEGVEISKKRITVEIILKK